MLQSYITKSMKQVQLRRKSRRKKDKKKEQKRESRKNCLKKLTLFNFLIIS